MAEFRRGNFWCSFIQSTYCLHSATNISKSLHSAYLLAFTLGETSIPLGFDITQAFTLTSLISFQCPEDSWVANISQLLLVSSSLSVCPSICYQTGKVSSQGVTKKGWVTAVAPSDILKGPDSRGREGRKLVREERDSYPQTRCLVPLTEGSCIVYALT